MRYASVKPPRDALRCRLRELAEARPSFGYRRLHVLLQREGWSLNHKCVYRLYWEEGLTMRKKTPIRRVACAKREVLPTAERKNDRWSMDFMSDQLFDGRRFRVLTLVENCTREALATHAAPRIKGMDVVEVLERVVAEHGLPKSIQVDNGPEFIGKDLDRWAYWNKVTLIFSRPGTPTDNATIESFNARCRQECLNAHWFLSLDDARETIEAWRSDYNAVRPHSSLQNLTPEQFAARVGPPVPAKPSPPAQPELPYL